MQGKNKPFYGWAITSMGTLGHVLQGGLIYWSMGIYTSTFEDHFGATRARVTLIESLLAISVNVMSPLMGFWVDRRSARHAVALGAVSLGSGLILISLAGTLVHIWVVFASLIPLGALALGMLPSSAIIARWFRRRRGLALGLSLAGTSIGGALAPPLLTYLFMAYGWRFSLQVCGVVTILLAPVFLKVLVNSPAERGEAPEAAACDGGAASDAADAVEWRLADLLRNRDLWLQVIVSGCLLAVTLGMLANLSLHAKDLGIAGQRVALLYSIIAFCSFAGKIGSGWLIDRIGLRRAGFITMLLMASGMQQLLLFEAYTALLAAAVVIGLATGGVMPLWTNLVARRFGARSVGRAIGLQNPLQTPLTAPSAPIAGYISDSTGSYDIVFVIYIGLVALSFLALHVLTRQGRDFHR